MVGDVMGEKGASRTHAHAQVVLGGVGGSFNSPELVNSIIVKKKMRKIKLAGYLSFR